MKPGQRGTKKVLAEYGEQLICVRYRYDRERKVRYKTIELIVEEIPWEPRTKRPGDADLVGVRIAWGEREMARRVKEAGGRWLPDRRLWELRYDRAISLGLKDRIDIYY